jgi:hypothetical protein
MKTGIILMSLAITASVPGCSDAGDPTPAGEISIAIQQSLTGQTTSAGTFTVSGVLSDGGETTEELTFGGVLTQPAVPITFRRVLTGRRGTMIVTGSATLTWTSSTTGTLSGIWRIESATGVYSSGEGTFNGNANFGATPPTAVLTYVGVINQ